MDKKLMGMTKSIMKHGEQVAPVKSIKLKVKFQKADKRSKALEKAKKMHSTPH